MSTRIEIPDLEGEGDDTSFSLIVSDREVTIHADGEENERVHIEADDASVTFTFWDTSDTGDVRRAAVVSVDLAGTVSVSTI